ncbi:MAG TPA: hypothetical protein VK605_04555 [Solirubrobacteraceae bacterium]|nr:hypothetical protein [Solirubrobacteraceae bacterium]
MTAHNLPIAAWPILLGVLGAHHSRIGRRRADAFVLGALLANTTAVGAAIGTYGARLLPYIPQLPLEWAALALGASAWLVQRRRALLISDALGVLVLIATLLLMAGALETFGVPHR